MPEDNKPRLIDRSHRPDEARPLRSDAPLRRQRSDAPILPHKPMRSLEELAPIGQKISENAELMRHFREVIGSDDRQRASAMIDEVRRVAQRIDPTITHPEGTTLALVLMKIVGSPSGGLE